MALNEGMQAPDMQTKIAGFGTEAKPDTPEDFAAYIAAQHRKWVEVGKAAGVSID